MLTRQRAAVLIGIAFFLGCASGKVGIRPDGTPACGVTSGGDLMSRTVSVERGTAMFYGLMDRQVARLDASGNLIRVGLFDQHGGQCRGERLVVKGFFSDTTSERIAGGQVAMPGLFSPTIYRYTASCSTCEAALGAYALHVLEEEDQAQRQQQQNQQKRP
jgi:hypothetical protein